LKEIVMPKLTMAMIKGKVEKWLKDKGEEVKEGEPVAEVESEKITSTISSPASGRLHILVEEGQEVAVGAPLGMVLEGDEAPPEISKPKIEVEAPAVKEIAPVIKEEPKPLVKASPAAKTLAKMYGLDLSQVKGTGPEGRISREDVEKIIEELALPRVSKVVQLKEIRKKIADRLSRSYNEALHTTVTMEADMSRIVELREKLLPEVQRSVGARLTYTAFLVKAVALALKEHPMLNSMLAGDEIRIFDDINVGVATAVEDGLLVPVLRNADRKTLAEIALEVERLAEKARKGELSGKELAGGTFTISNLGMYGVDIFIPIINPPECAILGIGKISKKPVVVNDRFEIRSTISLSLSFDHRIIDGAIAAKFLQTLKDKLENPVEIAQEG
jgi:pyruvate dehydrogenase E2 component (dihydrolipoamide acetyltransferase)